MKRFLILPSIFALTMSGAVLAQSNQAAAESQPPKAKVMESATTETSTDKAMPMRVTRYESRASNLMGAEINNAQNEEIGQIDDLIIASNDKVLYAIVSVGGFLGIGDKLVAIAYNDLAITRDQEDVKILYSATKEELKEKPEFRYNKGETPWVSRLGEQWQKLKKTVQGDAEKTGGSATDTTQNSKEPQ